MVRAMCRRPAQMQRGKGGETRTRPGTGQPSPVCSGGREAFAVMTPARSNDSKSAKTRARNPASVGQAWASPAPDNRNKATPPNRQLARHAPDSPRYTTPPTGTRCIHAATPTIHDRTPDAAADTPAPTTDSKSAGTSEPPHADRSPQSAHKEGSARDRASGNKRGRRHRNVPAHGRAPPVAAHDATGRATR